jgi:hypothetical protein
MDPYLEEPLLWPDVHLSLMTAMRDALAVQVAPAYYVRIEQRTYIARVNERDMLARPDVAIIAAPDAPPRESLGGTATAVAAAPLCVPLRRSELEPRLDLGELLAGNYDRARYDLSLDYRLPPPGRSLSPQDAAWLDALLRERTLAG